MRIPTTLQQVALSLLLYLGPVLSLYGQVLEQSLEVVGETNRSAANSQQKIDQLSRETRILLEEYRSLRESTEYQQAYTSELEQLQAAQQAQIESLNRQIAQARITRQRILPLMRSMAEALEQFVLLDLPFHQEERLAGVLQLKQRLGRPDLSVSARFRLLLEAYQIEQDYGVTLEAWRGPVSQEGETRSVEFLRLGRAALYFQSLDRETSAYWDATRRAWLPLTGDSNRALSQALRVARKETAPQLLSLPILAEGVGL